VADLIAEGEAFFEEQRRLHMSIDAEYWPKDSFVAFPVKATLVVGKWDMMDAANQIIRIETKDFFISTADYPAVPQRGDRIVYEVGIEERVFEVTLPKGRDKEWAWASRSENLRRIHTVRRALPTAVFVDGVYQPGVFAA
jgi:hypothetical protein